MQRGFTLLFFCIFFVYLYNLLKLEKTVFSNAGELFILYFDGIITLNLKMIGEQSFQLKYSKQNPKNEKDRSQRSIVFLDEKSRS